MQNLRSLPIYAHSPNIDEKEGVISSVAVAHATKAVGHRLLFDSRSLQQLLDLGNRSAAGIKSRFTHPGLSDDGLGKYLGRMKHFRLDGDRLLADLHLADASAISPEGNLRKYVIDLAREDPASFGVSTVCSLDKVWTTASGKEIPAKDPKPEDSLYEYPVARITKFHAADLVDEPALNPNGMFAAADMVATNKFSQEAFDFLDGWLEAAGIDHPHAFAVACQYFHSRGVDVNSITYYDDLLSGLQEQILSLAHEVTEVNMFRNQKSAIHNLKSKDFFSQVTSQIDDSSGWQSVSGRRHDRDYAEIQELYTDALTAWRKNPIAWRIITITSDFVIGRDFKLTSPNPHLDRFIKAFWNHPKNMLDLRLVPMCDELARAGDLFVALFRDPADGMSYIRFVTKDSLQKIITEPNDWETEIAYVETPAYGQVSYGQVSYGRVSYGQVSYGQVSYGQVSYGQVSYGQVSDLPLQSRTWHSPHHPGANKDPGILLHYAVNRPIGALMGESDLATMIPWLLRYSRMLEDRIRLHWAARAFLYLVTVPSNRVESKAEQYRAAPESGSIIVKDETEQWETMTPSLRGADAGHDMKAVRNLIDAGSGFPPHWRGEGGDVNLATAEAMQGPPERHLVKRQQYFLYIIEDILYHAYQRAAQLGFYPPLTSTDYAGLFTPEIPDVSLRDNTMLAQAANDIANAMSSLQAMKTNGASADFAKRAEELVLRFAGVRGEGR